MHLYYRLFEFSSGDGQQRFLASSHGVFKSLLSSSLLTLYTTVDGRVQGKSRVGMHSRSSSMEYRYFRKVIHDRTKIFRPTIVIFGEISLFSLLS
ncbi:MAG: hypothetical protein ACXAEU_25315 [Candidatus Hodarchaeales archaeon]|jgi:hypothetical protein